MPKFIAVTEEAQDPGLPKIRFHAGIDTDNQFTVWANDQVVCWFNSETGVLELCNDWVVPGLARDKDRWLAVNR